MNQKNHNDIGDDEIRIISQASVPDVINKRKSPRLGKSVGFVILCVSLVVLCVCLRLASSDEVKKEKLAVVETPVKSKKKRFGELLMSRKYGSAAKSYTASVSKSDQQFEPVAWTSRCDTVVDKVSLTVLTPHCAVPSLALGNEVLKDSDAVLVAQAADIRADNGEMVGTFVFHGKLMGRGQKKAGFCSIINGSISIGVADATPLFEQAIDTEGFFFRQYPLVVAGQMVENKPKGRAQRKALAEWNGETVVILSNDKLAFNDFARTLVSLGVSNAIYLVGSSAAGFYRTASGVRETFGVEAPEGTPANYIVWR